jgi:hypothetical protein
MVNHGPGTGLDLGCWRLPPGQTHGVMDWTGLGWLGCLKRRECLVPLETVSSQSSRVPGLPCPCLSLSLPLSLASLSIHRRFRSVSSSPFLFSSPFPSVPVPCFFLFFFPSFPPFLLSSLPSLRFFLPLFLSLSLSLSLSPASSPSGLDSCRLESPPYLNTLPSGLAPVCEKCLSSSNPSLFAHVFHFCRCSGFISDVQTAISSSLCAFLPQPHPLPPHTFHTVQFHLDCMSILSHFFLYLSLRSPA